ncbi:MAG: HupE/UreJ family protein [Ketobacteraceae bacterium]|nr:HupE/UreJ family protein [Ketobacteraceae bacterium]
MIPRLLITGMVIVLTWLMSVGAALAHPLAPSLFRITLHDATSGEVVWKQPVKQSAASQIRPELPGDCQPTNQAVKTDAAGAITETLLILCAQPLSGRQITFTGLASSDTYILAETVNEAGRKYSSVISGSSGVYTIPDALRAGQGHYGFFLMGVEHLLTGVDHVLFVTALVILLAGAIGRLILALSCFTVGHTLALFAAWNQWLVLPGFWIEVLIMLSLLWMALELVNTGRPAQRFSLRQRPYLLTLTFGLVHGSGFAGALLTHLAPGPDVVLNILAFNAGVEVGQVAVVLVVVAALKSLTFFRKRDLWSGHRRMLAPFAYGMGGISCYWLLKLTLG